MIYADIGINPLAYRNFYRISAAADLCHDTCQMPTIRAGSRVRAARLERGIGQGQLAAEAGISRQALSAIESGAYTPNVSGTTEPLFFSTPQVFVVTVNIQ